MEARFNVISPFFLRLTSSIHSKDFSIPKRRDNLSVTFNFANEKGNVLRPESALDQASPSEDKFR